MPGQYDQVEAGDTGPDIAFERVESAPCTPGQLECALQSGDHALDARSKVPEPTEDPGAPDHLVDLHPTLLMEGHILDSECLGRGEIALRGEASVHRHLTRRLAEQVDVSLQRPLDQARVGRIALFHDTVEDE